MNYPTHGEQQESEIKTIKERNITLNLSDADCERLATYAGKAGLTVSELLENFIGDLVDGTYSNGSDECSLANDWYERCGFDMFTEESLLNNLLSYEDIADIADFLEDWGEKEYFEQHPELYEDEQRPLWFEELIRDRLQPYIDQHPQSNISKEVEAVKKWYEDLQKLKGDIENGRN